MIGVVVIILLFMCSCHVVMWAVALREFGDLVGPICLDTTAEAKKIKRIIKMICHLITAMDIKLYIFFIRECEFGILIFCWVKKLLIQF